MLNQIKRYFFTQKTLGIIYMLHRCSPINNKNLYWNEHMKVSPDFLKNFLNEYRKTHIFLSMDELMELSKSGLQLKKPFIVMTFDDGYRDNYEYALPVFDEMRIPFTVYVTNSFPDRTAFLWWYVLDDILQKNDQIILFDGSKFLCKTKNEKEDVFLSLRQLILKLNQDKLVDEFKKFFLSMNLII